MQLSETHTDQLFCSNPELALICNLLSQSHEGTQRNWSRTKVSRMANTGHQAHVRMATANLTAKSVD